MTLVKREEVLDYVTYNEKRDEVRPKILKEKERRRIHIGEYLTILFENHDTVWYQIQEMTRIEQIVKESDIQHEIKTYNELATNEGELGGTLLIEIDDVDERAKKLTQWLKLPENLYVKLEDGTKVMATYDERQIGETRVSSVQYIRFKVNGNVPVAIGVDMPNFPEVHVEVMLTDDQRKALEEDLNK
jgi:hypothetical protein